MKLIGLSTPFLIIFLVFVEVSWAKQYEQRPVSDIEKTFKEKLNEIYKLQNNNLSERILLSQQLLEIAKRSTVDKYVAISHYEIGYSYEIFGLYEQAANALFEALNDLKDNKNDILTSKIYNELGLVFQGVRDYEQSLLYFNKFLEIQKELKDTAEIAGAFSNISLIYLSKEKYDSSLFFSNLSLKLRKKIGQESTIPISMHNIGEAYFGMGQFQEALDYFEQTKVLYKNLKNEYQIFHLNYSIINVLLALNDYSKALKIIHENKTILNKISGIYNKQLLLKSQYKYYKATNNSNQALYYFELFNQLSDSIQGAEIKEKLINLQVVYNLKEKNETIKLLSEREKNLELEKKNKNKNIFILISILFLAALTILFLLTRIKLRNRNIEILNLNIEKQKTNEKLLKSDIDLKNKQLVSYALNKIKYNDQIKEIDKIVSENKNDIPHLIKAVKASLKTNEHNDEEWNKFKTHFEEINQQFYYKLKQHSYNLTSNDYKICALIKINFNIKEMASFLNISPDSVKTARHRLRKKLNLSNEQDLHTFIQNIDNE
ncbi:MAG: tetratricopeptide repeat protein [Bacteroidales bacterium]|nr:tetratricopeptide repeat protein [Bacteroidales bacterium]